MSIINEKESVTPKYPDGFDQVVAEQCESIGNDVELDHILIQAIEENPNDVDEKSQKIRKLETRIYKLAKEKAIIIKRMKKLEEKHKKQIMFLRNYNKKKIEFLNNNEKTNRNNPIDWFASSSWRYEYSRNWENWNIVNTL